MAQPEIKVILSKQKEKEFHASVQKEFKNLFINLGILKNGKTHKQSKSL